MSLIAAINTLFQTNTVLQSTFPGYNNANGSPACTSNFWWDLAPENAPFDPPRCVASIIPGDTTPCFGGLNNYANSDQVIRYTVYAVTLAAAQTAAEAMVGVFNTVLPTMSAGKSLTNVYISSSPSPSYEGQSKGNADVFRSDTLVTYSPAVP